jgi:hypothetical protein
VFRLVPIEPTDAVLSFEFMGYSVDVSHVAYEEQAHHSLVERMLAAGSPWGLQDDLWQWTVRDGAAPLASDQELSQIAAVEGARGWIRGHPLEP